jgi:hypothetical protein
LFSCTLYIFSCSKLQVHKFRNSNNQIYDINLRRADQISSGR